MKFNIEVEADYLNEDTSIDEYLKNWIKTIMTQEVANLLYEDIKEQYCRDMDSDNNLYNAISRDINQTVKSLVESNTRNIEKSIAQRIATKMMMEKDLKYSEDYILQLIDVALSKKFK